MADVDKAEAGGGGERKDLTLLNWIQLIGTVLTVSAIIIEANRMRAYDVPASINLVGFDIVELLISNAVFYVEIFVYSIFAAVGFVVTLTIFLCILAALALVVFPIFVYAWAVFYLIAFAAVHVLGVAVAAFFLVILSAPTYPFVRIYRAIFNGLIALSELPTEQSDTMRRLSNWASRSRNHLDGSLVNIRTTWLDLRHDARLQLSAKYKNVAKEMSEICADAVRWFWDFTKNPFSKLTQSKPVLNTKTALGQAWHFMPEFIKARTIRVLERGRSRPAWTSTIIVAVISVMFASAWQYRNATFLTDKSVSDFASDRVPNLLRPAFGILRFASYLDRHENDDNEPAAGGENADRTTGRSTCPDRAEIGAIAWVEPFSNYRRFFCRVLDYEFPEVTLTVGQRNGPNTSQLEARPRGDEQNTAMQFQTERYYYLGDFGEWAFLAMAEHPDRRILVRRSTIHEASTFEPQDDPDPQEPPKDEDDASEAPPSEPGTDLREQLSALTARVEEISRLQRAVLLPNLRADLPSFPLLVPVPYLPDGTGGQNDPWRPGLRFIFGTGVPNEVTFQALINELALSVGSGEVDLSGVERALAALNESILDLPPAPLPEHWSRHFEELTAIATAINDLAQALPERSGTDPALIEELVRLQRALALQLAGQSETLEQIEAALVGPRLRPPVSTNWRWNWELSFQGNGGGGPATGFDGADAALMAALGQIGDNRITQALTVNACLRDGSQIGGPLLFGEGARRLTAGPARQLTGEIESFLATRRQSDEAEPLDLLVLGSASATGDPMGNLEISEDRAEHVAELIARAVTGRAFFDPDARHDALAEQNITLSAFGTGESSERGAGARQVRVFECGPTFETADPEPGVVETASDTP